MSLALEAGLDFLCDCRECRQVVHGKVGEHLAVDGQTRFVQPVNHRAIGQPAQPCGGVDARDPQRAELALLLAPSAICVLAGLDDGLLGGAEHLAPGIEITLRLLEDFLVASTSDDTAFNSCHILLTPSQANGSICFTRFMSVSCTPLSRRS